MVVDFVLGRVLLDKVEPRMLEVDTFVGLVTPVRREPFLDIEFVTELLEALELDLLRFSLELVGCRSIGNFNWKLNHCSCKTNITTFFPHIVLER